LVVEVDPKARDDLRRVLIRDQADRDAISSRLMRYRDQNGQRWADVIGRPDPSNACRRLSDQPGRRFAAGGLLLLGVWGLHRRVSPIRCHVTSRGALDE
jgi:hypothetical protein